ncbi:radical SAM protein [Candidatus Woesearchaeota archaeon]|nr:radical SAM protein [Candidatus Woesearchaeota archaeon]
MINDLKFVRKKDRQHLLFTKKGMVLSLNKKEYTLFKKYKEQKEFPKKHQEFFNRLANYGILKFENYNPTPVKKVYENKLYKANTTKPVLPMPIVAHLSLTNKCNMNCKYCSVRELNKKTEELSVKQFKVIIKKLSRLGIFQIGFTGGEPTLKKELAELVKYTEEAGCTASMTTNGWRLDEKKVEELKKAGLAQCQVSLDSHKESTHDKLRGAGSYKKALASISLLQKKGICVGIDCVVSKNNIKDIPAFIIWLSKNKIPYLTLIKLKKGDLSLNTFKELSADYEDYGKLIEKVCCRKNENPNITIDCGSVSNLQYTLRDNELNSIPTAGCPVGHRLITILPNGDIYPCAALLHKEFKLGNALKDSIKKIWNNNQQLKELRLVKSKVGGRCKSCDRLDFCRGGCRGIAYDLTNNLWGEDQTCRR